MSHLPRTLALTVVGGALVALSACSTTPGTASPDAATSTLDATPAAASAAPSTPATRDGAAACASLPALGEQVMRYPGGDPDAPPASPDQLRGWAAETSGVLEPLAQSVPVALDPQIATLRASLATLRQGQPLDEEDTSSLAMTALDEWGRGRCGFTTVDVVDPGSSLEGVPATLPAGPVSLSFTSTGPPEQAGFVLLVMRVRDGVTYDLDSVRDGTVDPVEVADVAAVVQPSPGATGFTTVELSPGRYLVVSPTGTPPDFAGILATELEVTAQGHGGGPGTARSNEAR